jgi:hypothetical protein
VSVTAIGNINEHDSSRLIWLKAVTTWFHRQGLTGCGVMQPVSEFKGGRHGSVMSEEGCKDQGLACIWKGMCRPAAAVDAQVGEMTAQGRRPAKALSKQHLSSK